MPELAPFRATRYTPAAGAPSGLLAPPYDVIPPALAEELRGRSPWNAVRLELPEGEGEERYALAAERLRDWLERGILAEDAGPAVYTYRQSFAGGSGPPAAGERRALLAALRLVPFESGEVLPHEETHGAPKADRLALTLACRAQLSPVFLTAADPEARLLAALERAEREGEPVLDAAAPEGERHRVWRVADPEAARELCAAAGAGPLLVADGHHRYETALAARERLADSPAASHVLACVASEADPGLRVLPTHRSLRAPAPDGSWAAALEPAFEAEPVEADAPGAVTAPASAPGEPPQGLVLVEAASGRAFRLRPRDEALAEAGLAGDGGALASLAFDRLVLRARLGWSAEEAARRGALSYHRDPREAIAAAGPRGAAFLLPPPRVAEVRSVAAAGRRLPPKSTYFHPKVPSGLAFRRL